MRSLLLVVPVAAAVHSSGASGASSAGDDNSGGGAPVSPAESSILPYKNRSVVARFCDTILTFASLLVWTSPRVPAGPAKAKQTIAEVVSATGSLPELQDKFGPRVADAMVARARRAGVRTGVIEWMATSTTTTTTTTMEKNDDEKKNQKNETPAQRYLRKLHQPNDHFGMRKMWPEATLPREERFARRAAQREMAKMLHIDGCVRMYEDIHCPAGWAHVPARGRCEPPKYYRGPCEYIRSSAREDAPTVQGDEDVEVVDVGRRRRRGVDDDDGEPDSHSAAAIPQWPRERAISEPDDRIPAPRLGVRAKEWLAVRCQSGWQCETDCVKFLDRCPLGFFQKFPSRKKGGEEGEEEKKKKAATVVPAELSSRGGKKEGGEKGGGGDTAATEKTVAATEKTDDDKPENNKKDDDGEKKVDDDDGEDAILPALTCSRFESSAASRHRVEASSSSSSSSSAAFQKKDIERIMGTDRVAAAAVWPGEPRSEPRGEPRGHDEPRAFRGNACASALDGSLALDAATAADRAWAAQRCGLRFACDPDGPDRLRREEDELVEARTRQVPADGKLYTVSFDDKNGQIVKVREAKSEG